MPAESDPVEAVPTNDNAEQPEDLMQHSTAETITTSPVNVTNNVGVTNGVGVASTINGSMNETSNVGVVGDEYTEFCKRRFAELVMAQPEIASD